MKLLPPADFQLFEAHRLDMLTSVGCFGGSRAARPVLELLRNPGLALSQERRIANVHWFAHARVRNDVRSIRNRPWRIMLA